MKLHICIPTLNRYDLLAKLIESIHKSDLLPEAIWIIDNGGHYIMDRLIDFVDEKGIERHIVKFGYNLGVAASWNWFIQHVPEARVIVNDDAEFFPDSLRLMLDAYDPNAIVYPAGSPAANSFSCFLIPDHVVECVGLFDERISPGWGYYEDRDYHYRMVLHGGLDLRGVPNCRLGHFGSATIKALSDGEMAFHNSKFSQATDTYLAKWGGLPHHEIYSTPYNRHSEDLMRAAGGILMVERNGVLYHSTDNGVTWFETNDVEG